MEQLPDSFADATKVSQSHIPAANTPLRIQHLDTQATHIEPRAKQGRPTGAADKQPRQRKSEATMQTAHPSPTTDWPQTPTPENNEIAINYNGTGKIWDRNKLPMDDQFIFQIPQDIMDELPDPKTITEAQKQPDWPKWKSAIN